MTSRTYRALLIANSTFPADATNLPELEGPRNDPVVLRDALCDREAGLFPADNVRLVTERTMAEVLGEVEDFLRSASRQDTVLLYYSGHGMLDQSGELFLCTRDSRRERLRSTAVKASDLRAMMDESAAAATVVVLDCCHSGRYKGGGDVPSALSGRGRFVLTSSRSGELANDADVRNHASLFTSHLAEGLRHGADDHDGDGVVTLSELYDYVHGALAGAGRPVPQKRFEGHGDVAIALRSAVAEPAGLVAPASDEPRLDLSETAIDLGEIAPDEDLPPERIAVINRGGGTLDWTVESSAPWLTAVAEEGAAVLHLRPVPGPNRANVYIRDATTGSLRTVRVSVRVRPAPAVVADRSPDDGEPATEAPAVVAEPSPPAPQEAAAAAPTPDTTLDQPTEPATTEPATADRTDQPAAGVPGGRWAALAVPAAFLVAGLVVAYDGPNHVGPGGEDIWFRGEWGAGLQASGLAGVVLAVVGLLSLMPRLHVWAIGCGIGVAVPMSVARIGEQVGYELGNFLWSWLLGAAAAAVAVATLVRLGAVRATPWAPRPLVGWATFLAGAWAASLLVDFYDQDAFGGSTYGGLWSADYVPLADGRIAARVWSLVAAASVVVLANVGLRRFAPAPGSGMVVGAAVIPLLAVYNEVAYLVAGDEDPDGARRLLVMVVPAVALTVAAVVAVVWSRREPAGSSPPTLPATARWARRRPGRAALGAALAALLTAVGWNALPSGPSGEQLLTIPETYVSLSPGAFSADGDSLAMTGSSWSVRDTWAGEIALTYDADVESVQAAAFAPDGALLALAGATGVDLARPSTGPDITHLGDVEASSVVFSPDGSLIAGGGPGGVTLWDTTTHEELGRLDGLADGGRVLAFSPDGSQLAVQGGDGAVDVWNVATLGRGRGLVDAGVGSLAVAFSPDWKLFALADGYGNISLADPGRPTESLRSLVSLDTTIGALAFSPDGEVLAVGAGRRVELFDAASGKHLTSLTGHDDAVTSLAFAPDGSRLASAGSDSVRLWDPDTR